MTLALHPHKLRLLNDNRITALAIGTYLGACDSATDRDFENTLVSAFQAGVTLVDTAINYRCQRSEKNIGFALRKYAGLQQEREPIFVATKGGFLPAENTPEDFQNYILKCFINTGILSPDDIVRGCHAMTPRFLQSQIDLSLANLKVKSIDLYYLHNPEIERPVLSEQQFYEKLTQAFALFEENVTQGKIKSYGLATWNGFRMLKDHPEYLDLKKVIQCAKTAGGTHHHFKAIQLPLNLGLLEALAHKNQGKNSAMNILQAAHEENIAILTSVPLMQGQLLDSKLKLNYTAPELINFVLSTPGITGTIVGTKSLDHLKNNLSVLSSPNLSQSEWTTIIDHVTTK